MDDIILELFDRAELFARLQPVTRVAIARVAERRTFSAGAVIFVEGSPSEYAFVVELDFLGGRKRLGEKVHALLHY